MRGLELLRREAWLSALDVELSRALGRLVHESSEDVLFAVALASRQVRQGHVCVDLSRVAGQPVVDAAGRALGSARFPELERWLAVLAGSRLVSDGSGHTPLVLSGHRLYLARYFEHERVLGERLLERVGPAEGPLERGALGPALGELFGPVGAEPDWQRVAAMLAVLGRACIVVGGPGTGKTTTVSKLLALLGRCSQGTPRVSLLAPTGKAAARLAETVGKASPMGPVSASTIHRALGPLGADGTRFRHDRDNPLPTDVVVVDESSMVDVALMRRLLDAVPLSARLVLLGDADQLASVEAGAVLGDICAGAGRTRWSDSLKARALASFGERLPDAGTAEPARLSDSLVVLTKSHRFEESSGIGALARAIRSGDAAAARSLVVAGSGSSVELVEGEARELGSALGACIVEGYGELARARSPRDALAALDRFRILCAHRTGPLGALALNELAERVLSDAGSLDPARSGRHYPGRPLLVTENDYEVGLFNGDVGVIWPSAAGGLRAHFAAPDGSIRELSPARLPEHETVFAMSIHKSQGSEFDRVAVVLPEPESPLATRELLYTAVTRARSRALLVGSLEALERCVSTGAQRASGLRAALWREGL